MDCQSPIGSGGNDNGVYTPCFYSARLLKRMYSGMNRTNKFLKLIPIRLDEVGLSFNAFFQPFSPRIKGHLYSVLLNLLNKAVINLRRSFRRRTACEDNPAAGGC